MNIQIKHLYFILSLIVVLRIFGAGTASAESADLALNLEEAVTQALRHNPVLKAEKERLQIHHARLEQAKRFFQVNPELSIDADYRRRKFALPSGKTGTDFELRLLQEIEISGQAQHRIAAAKNNLKASRWQLMDSERRLILQVRQRFYHLLALQEKMKVQARRLVLNEDLFKAGMQRFEQEDISILEIDTLRFDRDQAQYDLSNLEAEKLTIEKEMHLSLGLNKGSEILVTAQHSTIFLQKLKAPDSLQELEECALAHRPDLKAIQHALERDAEAFELALSNKMPNLSLGPLYKSDNEDQVIGASLMIPLPFFNRNQKEIAEAQVNRNMKQIELDAKKREIRQEATVAYRHFKLAKARFDLYDADYLERLIERMAFPKRAYRAGEISIFEFSIIQGRLSEAQMRYFDVLLALRKVSADLDAQRGACPSLRSR